MFWWILFIFNLCQVILKPDPGNSQDLFIGSLSALGCDCTLICWISNFYNKPCNNLLIWCTYHDFPLRPCWVCIKVFQCISYLSWPVQLLEWAFYIHGRYWCSCAWYKVCGGQLGEPGNILFFFSLSVLSLAFLI